MREIFTLRMAEMELAVEGY